VGALIAIGSQGENGKIALLVINPIKRRDFKEIGSKKDLIRKVEDKLSK
jgi:hypothetical protein